MMPARQENCIFLNVGLGNAVDALIKTNNLSDLPDKGISRVNLGVAAGVDKQMCNAWASWSNNGAICTINDSFGVSSVTRTGQGTCLVNFSTAMANAKYSATYTPGQTSDVVNIMGGSVFSKAVAGVSVLSWQGVGIGAGVPFARNDFPDNNIHIFGGK